MLPVLSRLIRTIASARLLKRLPGNDVNTTPRGFIIAAPASGTGKTVLTLGLVAALRQHGLRVAVAKTGPDYIDPQFLAAAAGGPCLNLDPWAMPPEDLRARTARHAEGADLLVVEGVMGLFDGAAGGGGSTADLADVLGLPVILAVDAGRQAQSIAATVHGFATFRPRPEVCGVIATHVASDRHAGMVQAALDELTLPYLGALRKDSALTLLSRHLGLVQAHELAALTDVVHAARANVAAHLDLDQLVALSGSLTASAGAVERLPSLGQHIAVADDVAFGFAYPHMLGDWQAQGAQITPFSPLKDEAPSEIADAVFLPGGYPELYAGQLAAAYIFLDGLKQAAGRGALIYGECGGYMVLGRALIDADGVSHRMADLLGHVTTFAERKRHLGYRTLENAGHARFFSQRLRGHEFHYSALADAGRDPPLFRASDSRGVELGDYGGCRGTVMGSYAHVISVCA